MVLPQDPYEAITEELIDNARERRVVAIAKVEACQRDVEELNALIAAYRLAIQDYRSVRPVLHRNGLDVYQDDARLREQLQGLTNLVQRLIVLGLIHERDLEVNNGAHAMHRIGIIGGEWKNVLPRCYTTIGQHPEIFMRIENGIYRVLPGAEDYLPEHYRMPVIDNDRGEDDRQQMLPIPA